MAISKIQYDNKVAINIDSTIPDINKCNASDLNEIKSVVNNNADEIPTKVSELENDSEYITCWDYASDNYGGTIRTGELTHGTSIEINGKLYAWTLTYPQYQSAGNIAFIGKGTLENVITGKGLIDKDVNDLTNYTKTSDLSSVATSGSYNDLIDTPTIPSISDEYGTSTTDGYSQNYINTNTLNPSGEPSTSEEDVSSATFTNTLEAPINIDLKGNTEQDGTPTPSSPIPVNVVSGDNDVVVCGKNLLDLSNISWYRNNNSDYSIITDTSTTRVKSSLIEVSGGTYTISGIPSALTLNTNAPYCYDSNKTYLGNGYATFTNNTITLPSNVKYISLILNGTDLTDAIKTTLSNSNMQLEQGNQATTYEAYNGTTYNIDLPVENLFDKDNANIMDTTINSSTKLIESSNQYKMVYIPCLPNTTYTISKVQSGYLTMGFTDELPTTNVEVKNYINSADTTECTETSLSTSKYIVLRYYRINDTLTESEIRASIQIEYGSKANTYTPYGTTPIELNKIGTYQDYFYKENNTWYLHKEVGKVVLDGSEEGWDYNFNCFRMLNSTFKTYDTTVIGEIYSNYFIKNSQQNLQNINADYGISYRGSPANGYVIRNKDITSINDFKTWLGTHNVEIRYLLTTPTNTEITYTPLINQLDNLQNAMSKKGTTNVNQVNNDLPFILDLSVFNDTYNGRYQSVLEMYKRLSSQ